jgi:hypothetical protein
LIENWFKKYVTTEEGPASIANYSHDMIDILEKRVVDELRVATVPFASVVEYERTKH